MVSQSKSQVCVALIRKSVYLIVFSDFQPPSMLIETDVCTFDQQWIISDRQLPGCDLYNKYTRWIRGCDAVNPVVVPDCPIPYHLRDRADKVIQEMLDEGIIEPKHMDEPLPWVSAPLSGPQTKKKKKTEVWSSQWVHLE